MHGATYGKIHFIKQKLLKYVFNFFRANARNIARVNLKVGRGSTFTFTRDLPYIVYKIYVRTQAKITQQ